MKVLIVGGGGREHALAWKCAQSASVAQVWVAPGNAGTEREPKIRNVAIEAADVPALENFARHEHIDLTIVGPEIPLAAGIVDRFDASGLLCFGPTQAAAQLESSKAFCKEFLQRNRIPTAAYARFDARTFDEKFIRRQRLPIVVKADGLASGKGVVICSTHDEAARVARGFLSGELGAAGRVVVVEEFLHGEEASFIVMVHGEHIVPLATSQDHKRRDDGDAGPNTGGMGAYSPAPVVTSLVHARALREVIQPAVHALTAQGTPYVGFLYAGLMISPDGALNVLEFNCRLGDPETQPILMRLRSDLAHVCAEALRTHRLPASLEWDDQVALGVVLSAAGYPGTYEKGAVLSGLDRADGMPGKIFHAGTARTSAGVVTAGGRVLCAVGMGDDTAKAREQAYALVDSVEWPGAHYRRDIGYRALIESPTASRH